METKTFTITAGPILMKRFERFLALLHWNSKVGHSALFAMPLDGDGDDKLTVSPSPNHFKEVDLIGGVGGHIEIAYNNSYGVLNMKHLKHNYTVENDALFKDETKIK